MSRYSCSHAFPTRHRFIPNDTFFPNVITYRVLLSHFENILNTLTFSTKTSQFPWLLNTDHHVNHAGLNLFLLLIQCIHVLLTNIASETRRLSLKCDSQVRVKLRSNSSCVFDELFHWSTSQY